MKKLVLILLIMLIGVQKNFAFGPPLYRFYIKNSTQEKVLLHYILDDYIVSDIAIEYRDGFSVVDKIMEPNEIVQVMIPHTALYNLKYSGEIDFMQGYINIIDFMSLLKEFSFILTESKKEFYKDDMKQDFLEYTVELYPKNTHVFVLNIR